MSVRHTREERIYGAKGRVCVKGGVGENTGKVLLVRGNEGVKYSV